MCVCARCVCVHSPVMLKGKLENGRLCVCVCVFWVIEVLFLCFLGWECGNNGHIVWRVGKEERGEVEGEDEEEEGGGEDRKAEENWDDRR